MAKSFYYVVDYKRDTKLRSDVLEISPGQNLIYEIRHLEDIIKDTPTRMFAITPYETRKEAMRVADDNNQIARDGGYYLTAYEAVHTVEEWQEHEATKAERRAMRTTEIKKYRVDYSFGAHFDDPFSFTSRDDTAMISAASAEDAARNCSQMEGMEDAIYKVYEYADGGGSYAGEPADISFRDDKYNRENDPSGIKAALMQYRRFECSHDWRGNLMYDKSIGAYWVDEYDLHSDDYKDYNDPNIVNLGDKLDNDEYLRWAIDNATDQSIESIAEIVQDYVDEYIGVGSEKEKKNRAKCR